MIYIILGLILLVCVLIAVFIICYKRKNKRYCQFVITNSLALQKLDELNRETHFYDLVNWNESHTYDNRITYEGISCTDYLIYQLQYKQHNVLEQIRRATYNNEWYEKYCKKVEQIKKFGNYNKPIEKYNKKYLLLYEKKLFNQGLKHPQIDFVIRIDLYRSDINGRIFDKKSYSFDANQIEMLIKRLNNKNGSFYLDRDIWDSICRVERGMVSNKMRFSIYKRDGNRCCNCGRSGRFVNLEIDHIKPISKGGKSTYDNLQTLCHECNQRKGDTYNTH